MSSPIITVENLGKAYTLGLKEEKFPTFREALVGAAKAPLRRFRHLSNRGDADEQFWAVRDVSFEAQRGEVVGIIGRNGAGKSTLLKILSRITEPTTGRAVLRGRVASLLEVGTGFHPELSGRENVYLNGSILGMKKVEIDRKFDEIVAFADVERFLDTPVKRYSSGMYVRLAFAVAAHLEPEILIVDEVLAVGDAEFQRKCLGKMHDVAEHDGRTVLFVSHNMDAISRLCEKCIILTSGVVSHIGVTESAIRCYGKAIGDAARCVSNSALRSGDGAVRVTNVQLLDVDGRRLQSYSSGQLLSIEIEYRARNLPLTVELFLSIADSLGTPLVCLDSHQSVGTFRITDTPGRFLCTLPSLPLAPGEYIIDVKIAADGRAADRFPSASSFRISGCQYSGYCKTPSAKDGRVVAEHKWTLRSVLQ